MSLEGRSDVNGEKPRGEGRRSLKATSLGQRHPGVTSFPHSNAVIPPLTTLDSRNLSELPVSYHHGLSTASFLRNVTTAVRVVFVKVLYLGTHGESPFPSLQVLWVCRSAILLTHVLSLSS
jgi:hypothetical protein